MSVPALRFPEFEGGWADTKLVELVDPKRKITYGIVQPGEFVDEGIYLVRGGDYSNGWSPREEFKKVTLEIDRPYRRSKLKAGDLLITIVGANTGNVATVPKWLEDANITQTTARIAVEKANAVPQFIEKILASRKGQKEVYKYIKGAAQPGLNLSDLEKFQLTVPSLPEQKKIAAFLGVVDAKIAALRARRDGLERYKRGLMQALFSQTLRFTKPDGTAFPDWEEKRLGEIADFSKGKGISKADIVQEGATECIRYGELYTTYREIISDIFSRTNVASSGLVLSQKGDVIIPASGEDRLDMARASCVEPDGVALGGDLNILRGRFNGHFFAYYLSNHKRKDIARFAQGNSVVHLYGTQLKIMDVEVPHPDEQAKIAEALSAMDAKIAAVEDQVTKMEAFKKGLLQQMFV